MKYLLVLFFSVVFLGSFLIIEQTQAADCNKFCGSITDLDLWNDCMEKCQNEGGTTSEPIVPATDDAPQKASSNSGSFKDIGTKLGNVSKGFYGDVVPKSFEETIGGYIKTGLALVGVIFLLLMVYGGYTWMIARGDETEATKAKDTITMASIGMAVVLIAYVITYFILSYALESGGFTK